eukprot:452261-Prorocentrum_lima.AAC.1
MLDVSLGKRPATAGLPGLSGATEEGRLLSHDELLVRDVNYPPSIPLVNPEWAPLEAPEEQEE